MSTDIAKSHRDAIKQLSPPWLSRGVAEKLLYDIGLSSDAIIEKMNQAMQAHMPGRGDPSALPIIGSDRLLSQGPNESNDAFARRLQTAFDAWQSAGSNRAILQQVLGYVSDTANAPTTQLPIGAIVSSMEFGGISNWDIFYATDDTSKPPHHIRIEPHNWNWDDTYEPHRAFLILYFYLVLSGLSGTTASFSAPVGGFATITGLSGMTASVVGQYLRFSGASTAGNNSTFQISQFLSSTSVKIAHPTSVSDANNGSIAWELGDYTSVGPAPAFGTPGVTIGGDSSISIGLSVSNAYVLALRNLVRLWKSASTFVPWIIICYGGGNGGAGTEFSPNSSDGSGNPDGQWATWAKTVAGVSVPARVTGVNMGKFDAFIDGTALYQLSYVPTGT